MSIEKLKELKRTKYPFGENSYVDNVLDALLNSTIDLLEREKDRQADKYCEENLVKKWSPLSKGFYHRTNNIVVKFDEDDFSDDGRFTIDMGWVCKTEKQAEEKHKQLRAYSRLQSLVMEYGDYKFIEGDINFYPMCKANKWSVAYTRHYSPVEIFHTQEVIEDVCRRLNNGEAEL
ncbi:MAG: hypothetical protein WC901_00930 [Candidatus Margulisiibacteriota bacterium]